MEEITVVRRRRAHSNPLITVHLEATIFVVSCKNSVSLVKCILIFFSLYSLYFSVIWINSTKKMKFIPKKGTCYFYLLFAMFIPRCALFHIVIWLFCMQIEQSTFDIWHESSCLSEYNYMYNTTRLPCLIYETWLKRSSRVRRRVCLRGEVGESHSRWPHVSVCALPNSLLYFRDPSDMINAIVC